MKALAERIGQLALWLDQRSLRERILLPASILVAGLFCSYALFFEPQGVKRHQVKEQIVELNTTVAELDRQAEAIESRAQDDPDREHRLRQQQLQAEIGRLDERLKDLTVDLISPRDMAEVLRGLLTRQGGMKLVSLENLPAVELLPAAENEAGAENETAADDTERINLYRHPVRIVVSGSYLQALDYLRELERMPRKLFWDELEIVVGDYPHTEISLTVYTLSHRKGWIGV